MISAAAYTLPLTIGMAAVSAGIAIPVAADALASLIHRIKTRARLSGEAGALAGKRFAFLQLLFSDLCRNGVKMFRPMSAHLSQVGVVRRQCENIVKALRCSQQGCAPCIVCELLLLCLLISFLLGTFVSASVVVGAGLAIVTIWLILAQASKVIHRWEVRFREQIPDALRSIGVCFSAGFSLQQALEQTARDIADPLGREFVQVTADIRAGRSLEEALRDLEQRTNVAELRFVSVALEIQHHTGGSLQQLLDNAAASILSSFDLHRSLAVQTAQARMSAKVVTLMPLVLVLVLSLMMEGYIQSFFSSPAGLLVFFSALAMEASGILVIRRILGLKLD